LIAGEGKKYGEGLAPLSAGYSLKTTGRLRGFTTPLSFSSPLKQYKYQLLNLKLFERGIKGVCKKIKQMPIESRYNVLSAG
jgi:hypothetical protein